MSGPPMALQYASRTTYARGMQDILLNPVLTMAQEFARDYTWTDRRGVSYNLQNEWKYVDGPARRLEKCTPGTRDENNDNKTPEDFLKEENELIEERRKNGCDGGLPESYATLTRDEVLAVRLYTGPVYEPLNTFLRQISTLGGDYRTAVADHPGLTFAATVGHICHAIRKLAAVVTPEEAEKPLYRGVRGELPNGFWARDKNGIVCATDCALMSTSMNKQTPIDYMDDNGSNVLWELKPSPPTDDAYHRGADVSRLSQFSAEAEVLFPPCTMLMVQQKRDPSKTIIDADGLEDMDMKTMVDKLWKDFMVTQVADEHPGGRRRTYLSIKVVPNFV